jgi:hypothetical protein
VEWTACIRQTHAQETVRNALIIIVVSAEEICKRYCTFSFAKKMFIILYKECCKLHKGEKDDLVRNKDEEGMLP